MISETLATQHRHIKTPQKKEEDLFLLQDSPKNKKKRCFPRTSYKADITFDDFQAETFLRCRNANPTLSCVPVTALKNSLALRWRKHDVVAAQKHVCSGAGLAEMCGAEGPSHFAAASSYKRAAIVNRRTFARRGEEEENGGEGERRRERGDKAQLQIKTPANSSVRS